MKEASLITPLKISNKMLDSWYNRSVHQGEDEDEEEEEEIESQEEVVNYKTQYRNLKRKLKYLIYENECFQETLKNMQRQLLKATRDRSFLLDRLLQYEKVDVTTSESEETESSDEAETPRPDPVRRKKPESNVNSHSASGQSSGSGSKGQSAVKKRRPNPKSSAKQNSVPPLQVFGNVPVSMLPDGHMTSEEVDRHLESRQSYMEPVPEKALSYVPTEMFSNDPSLDSESNEIFELETSPSNMGEDCLSVDMIPE
ncbi:INO80 complex subunit E [Gryllus bimaculatus]|nr:INO80 complex subunit E [Gryllus bimaculatus]